MLRFYRLRHYYFLLPWSVRKHSWGWVQRKAKDKLLNTNARRRIRAKLLSVDPRCYYCLEPLTEQTATLEHLIPFRVDSSKFGDESNITLACKPCNHARGDLMPRSLHDDGFRQLVAAKAKL